MTFIETLSRRGNDALQQNPTVADLDIVTAASDFLWMVFSVMAATTLGVGIWAAVGVKRGQRTFHHLSMMITGTASIAYFCMASDLGATAVPVEFVRTPHPTFTDPITRSIWYARYIDWTITTPLLLLELLLVTGLPLSDVVITIFADIVMIITGLIGALVPSRYKWGLFSIGCFAMFYVFYMLYFPGRVSSKSLGSELSKTYLIGAGILSFLWFLYPIAWGLCDGGNVISPTAEMVFYGVLDLCAKPVFALVHLFSMRRIDYTALELSSGKHTDYGAGSIEKGTTSAPAKNIEHPSGSPDGHDQTTLQGH